MKTQASQAKKRRSKGRKKGREDGQAGDMTPMIDVTFLLLIFFLCLEFKSLEGKLASNLPKDSGHATSAREPVERLALRIAVVAEGTATPDPRDPRRVELVGHRCEYWLGRRRAQNLESLEVALRGAAEIRVPGEAGRLEQLPLVVHTGPDCRYVDVTTVLDLARETGFSEISFGGR